MREFPQTSYVLHPLGWVIPLAILVWIVLAVLLLRTNREAQSGDAFAWIIAGLVLTPMFYARGENDWELRDVRATALFTMWAVVFLTCAFCWFRVVREKEGQFLNLGILGIVASVVCSLLAVVPSMQYMRETGPGPPYAQCKSNLHNIGLALDNYREEYAVWPAQQLGNPLHSWRVDLLPYVDRPNLHQEYDFTETWNSDVNAPLANELVPIYWCPSMDWPDRDDPKTTAYAYLVGHHAAWTSNGLIDPDDIPDGAGHTAIVAEACGLGIIWTEPRDIDLATTPVGINLPGDRPGHSPGILSTYHAKGANVLMADGSVRSLVIETDQSVLEAMLTADGGENVTEF